MFAIGLLNADILLKYLNSIDQFETSDNTESFFAKLGELRLKEENEELESLLSEINSLCLSHTSDEEKLNIIKFQHPKYILKSICEGKNSATIGLFNRKLPNGKFQSIVVYNNEEIVKVTGDSFHEAERLACLQALSETFADEFEAFRLDDSITIPVEDSINLEVKSRKKRQVYLTKSVDESYGFTIRGGERKVVRSKEYIQEHITTPVFISLLDAGSPAERCGLHVGDVLLGVNDHSLVDSTHKQAVTSLKKFLNSEEVLFTVKHSMKEVRKYEAEQRYLEKEKERIREELNSETYSKWHDAKAKENPEEYLLEQLKDKKRPYKPKKHRQSLRLWDY